MYMAEFNEKKSIYGWNKDSLSWSAYSTWKGSKESYRDRYYYETRPNFQTPQTMFGNKIGDYLENNHKDVDHVEKYSKPEHRIYVKVDGVKLIGYLDSFDPKQCRFLEYKTSHRNKKGQHQWDYVKVAKHRQLDFYSMLIKEKYGKVQNQCKLIYMETEKSNITYKGHVLESVNYGLRLTGTVFTFKRSIEDWEREAIKKDIIKVANEIKEDYERHKKKYH